MKKKTQIFFIHGGSTFRKREDYLKYLSKKQKSLDKREYWVNDYTDKNLGDQFQIIRPTMPCKKNAKYVEWKIFFGSYFDLLNDDIIFVASSLGGIFLAKYLSENKFPKKILSVYLICPPYDNTLPGEDLVGGFRLKKDLSLLQKQTENLYLMFSADDNVVPVQHAEKYRSALPDSKIIIYKSKNGHFGIKKFPEIIRMIKKDTNTN